MIIQEPEITAAGDERPVEFAFQTETTIIQYPFSAIDLFTKYPHGMPCSPPSEEESDPEIPDAAGATIAGAIVTGTLNRLSGSSLLHHMGQLMRQQLRAFRGMWSILTCIEINIITCGECPGIQFPAQLHSIGIRMYTYLAKIRADTAFHKVPGFIGKRLSLSFPGTNGLLH